MHISTAMARLNPTNVRLDTGMGGGGQDAMTAQMIAGAIAFVPAGRGRELLCHKWWPDGAKLTAARLQSNVAKLLLDEWNRREDAFNTGWMARAVAVDGHAKARAQLLYAEARQRRWPEAVSRRADDHDVAATYAGIVKAVLDEIQCGGRCEACDGSGEVVNANRRTTCKNCRGTTLARPSDRSRADAIGLKSNKDYARIWRRVYEWLLALLEEELAEAEAAMVRAIK